MNPMKNQFEELHGSMPEDSDATDKLLNEAITSILLFVKAAAEGSKKANDNPQLLKELVGALKTLNEVKMERKLFAKKK